MRTDARTHGRADAPAHRGTDAPGHRSRNRITVSLLALVVLAGVAAPSAAQQTRLASPLPPLRQQADIRAQWIRFRLDSVLPALLRKYDVQMWVVSGRENNEDPVYGQLVPGIGASMGRRTILVFFDRGPGQPLERLALGSGGSGLYRSIRDTGLARQMGSFGQDRFTLLRRVVEERNPRTIAIDVSEGDAYADGLSAGDLGQLETALGPQFWPRVRHAEGLVIDYFAIRAPAMMETYLPLQRLAHDIIATAFSNQVIRPGTTRADDVAWWARQTLADLGLGAWFNPYITVQRRGADGDTLRNPVLLPGDVLHIDFGITGLGLNTDTQHMAYVLREGETDAPAGLTKALTRANRLQDILLEKTKPGKTGNQVLREVLGQMSAEGLDGTMYSHPIGDHGHAAGPIIGLWDYQEGVPGRGDVPVLPNMWFSTEMQVTTPVPEWNGQKVRMAVEEEAEVRPDGVMAWVLRRQTELHLVR